MGPSGSGKTTLLNLIAGIDTPTSGEILIDGNDIARLSRAQLTRWRSKHVGYIFQLYHLVPILSAYENIELPLLLGNLSKKQHITRAEIIDFKTDRIHTNNSIEQATEQHRPQLEAYRDSLSKIIGLDASAIDLKLLFTDVCELVTL